MATIKEKGNRYYVIYSYRDIDGTRKQKWETCKTLAEAKHRKTEIEYKQNIGNLNIPACHTIDELITEYVALYGKNKWSFSMYNANMGLIRNYISPMIGSFKLTDVTTHVIEKYYLTLLETEIVPQKSQKKYSTEIRFIQPPTVRKIHNLLRSAFNQAVKWGLVEKNNVALSTVPKAEKVERDIWDADTLQHALEVCKDDRLKLCINLSFACSLRIGEVLGLTWNCIDLSEQSLADGSASIFINKELQRVNKEAVSVLGKKDIIATFPEANPKNKTMLVLKKPKTLSSIRKVFLPHTLAQMLLDWKKAQQETKDILGDEYCDYDLVITGPFGTPVESSRIMDAFRDLIKENNLPKVVFHSLRHTSITYKLRLNGGDIKAVQGDSGHAQAKMVTDQYSHILDDNRISNAKLIEKAFYKGNCEDDSAGNIAQQAETAGIDQAMLAKVLSNPDMVKLLKTLAASI